VASFDAFIELYEREGEAVLVFMVRRTLDVDVSVDLTAETFAQAWRGWSRLRVRSAEELRAWLFVIARRQLGRYLRRGRVERRALERFGLQAPLVHEDDRGEIERAAGLGELRAALGIELARLSVEQREALQLRIVDEMSYAEVASRLGVSEPAARARVSRGLRALALALEPIALKGGNVG
jgi:RNA polymerase sigma-70 factor (ECF subfamily)